MSVVRLMALEVNAVHHCNLACVGCSHASPVAPVKIADPDQVQRDFAGLAGIVVLDHVKVVGGEPLLHPDLAGLLLAIRRSGIGCRVRVATNGTLLHRAGWDWLAAADDVHISRYPGTVIDPDAMAELSARCDRAGKQLLIKSYQHFRLVEPADRLDAADAQAVFDSCQLVHAWSCHTVEDGYVYLCPPALPVDRPAEENARCSIGPRAGLAERLQALLSRRAPLEGCSTCLGSVGNLVPHSQANRKTWIPLSRNGRIDRGQLAHLQAGGSGHNGCYVDDELLPGHAGTAP